MPSSRVRAVQTLTRLTQQGFQRDSLVTLTEDVSYVGSPYLPACLRTRWGRPLSDNSHRANECAAGHDNVRDELSEAVHLSYVCVVVGVCLWGRGARGVRVCVFGGEGQGV